MQTSYSDLWVSGIYCEFFPCVFHHHPNSVMPNDPIVVCSLWWRPGKVNRSRCNCSVTDILWWGTWLWDRNNSRQQFTEEATYDWLLCCCFGLHTAGDDWCFQLDCMCQSISSEPEEDRQSPIDLRKSAQLCRWKCCHQVCLLPCEVQQPQLLVIKWLHVSQSATHNNAARSVWS